MARSLKLGAQALALLAVGGLLALLIWKVAHQDRNTAAREIASGRTGPAPHFELPRLDVKGDLSLASLRGKAVVINFWASWCVPCKEEAPLLEEVWRNHRDQGLVVLGVDINDLRGDARRFARQNRMSYPLGFDGMGETSTDYGLTGVPETFFIARSGKLVCDRLQAGVHLEANRTRFDECVQEVLSA